MTAPANITVAATNAGGTAASDATITAFINAASANDAVDGPIATINNDAPTVFPLGATTVTFSAIDSDGNTGSAQATVTVSDQDVPVITRLGLASITLNVGDPFTDPGATATDNVDGNLTPAIVAGGSVNTGAAGIYTLTYDVSDTAANAAVQVTRSVSVQDAGAPVVMPPAPITVAAVDASGTADSDAAIVAFLAGAIATDNVDGAIATITNNAPAFLAEGDTPVTFSATDAAGNTGTAQAIVTVTPFVSVDMIAFSRNVGGQFDLFAIAEDGSGSEVMLANDTGDEVFGGSTSDNRVIYVRDMGVGLNDIFSISDDGSGPLVTLTNDARDELPVAVTASNRVIFMRTTVAPADIDLLSRNANGSGSEVSLAVTADFELFGGLTSDGRVVYDSADALLFPTFSDVYSINADGSGGTVTLANGLDIEAGGGIASGTLVVFARTVGGLQNDIFTRGADGMSAESPLVATLDDELPVGVTASDLVIFMRTSIFTFSLWSIGASGTPVAVQLASADGTIGDFLAYGGSTGGRVIYNRCNLINGLCDVFSRNANGSGPEATLAADPVSNESFAGISSDGLVIIVRENAGTTDLISINADGAGETVLATAATPVPPGEVFKGVTANGRVIFEREVGGFTNLYSIKANDNTSEVPLAATATTDETFGGIF